MKIYVAISGLGSVITADMSESAVRITAEIYLRQGLSNVTDTEWREEDGRERLYYRNGATGRWNSIPSVYFETVEH